MLLLFGWLLTLCLHEKLEWFNHGILDRIFNDKGDRVKPSLKKAILLTIMISMFCMPAAQADDKAELAKAAQNPIANLISLPLQFLFPK